MRKYVVAGLLAVVFLGVLGTARADAGPIRITGVSCRSEWVDVKNTSNRPKNLQGFRLFDHNKVHRFDYPSVNVPPGAKVRVWAAGGSGGPVRRWYTGWNQAIFNDRGEEAILVNPNRDVVSRLRCGDALPPPPPPGNCHPSYSPCLPNVSDLDCADIGHQVQVHGPDKYNLDADGDNVGCDSYPPA
jgi:hypothetical protein